MLFGCKYKDFFVIDKLFLRKERLKRQKIAKSSICFEFQVVVAVVGFKWHRRGNAKTQIEEIETLSNHYLAETP